METEKLMELRKWRGMNIAKTTFIDSFINI